MRTLFRIKRLVLRRGQKMAVVGSNGCGKSTLLRSLAGKVPLPGGEIKFLLPNAQVVMVEQSPRYEPEQTVTEAVYAGASSPQAAAARRFRGASATGAPAAELQAALEGMDAVGGWDWDARAVQTLEELGLAPLKDRKMGMLSGGEERRVALACALVDIEQTDLLILDEPTNHLSAEGCDWLQETLQALKGVSLVLVTHDRYFLDEVCDDILEIDGLGDTFTHPGGWNTFLTRRAERFERRAALVNDAKVQLKRAQEWIARGPRGRGTKNKAQIAGYHDVKDKAEAVVQADDGAPTLGGSWARTGGKGQRTQGGSQNLGIVGLHNVTVLREDGHPILDRVSFEFGPGMKVGIVGPNGAGKSTFLRALAGILPLQGGARVIGDGVRLGFLTQEAPKWPDPRQKVMAVVAEMADEVLSSEDTLFPEAQGMSRERATASLLRSVNFQQDRWQTELGMLSGGESRRLQLLRALSRRPNVLLLDEPTNDLDAVTVDALERLLQPWPGTVVLVSHDRSLLDGVCQAHLVFPKDGGPPRMWHGSHASLRESQRQREAVPASQASPGMALGSPAAPARSSPKERAKAEEAVKKMERQIEKAEARLAQLRAEMESAGGNSDRVMELYAESEALEATQAELYERWEALANSLER